MNAKGMSMAIQIFIVLFVLLAVAMLVLRMVTEQTEQQIKIFSEEQKKQELGKLKSECKSACRDLTTLKDKVSYCLRTVNSDLYEGKGFDFTGNGFTRDYAEPPETGGLYGLCEDRIYCSQLIDCKVGNQILNMKNCFDLICSLWSEDPSRIPVLMEKFFPPPTCDMTPEQQANHWRNVYANDMTCPRNI